MFGKMGQPVDLSIDVDQFRALMRGYWEGKDSEYKLGWNQTRWLGLIVANSQGAKKKRPEDLMRFPWEEDKIDELEKIIELGKQKHKWYRGE